MDSLQAATVNARFLSYLEQVYAPRNPRHLLAATTLTLLGTAATSVALVTFIREIQLIWPLFAFAIFLITSQVLRLHRRFATRHRLLRVRDVIENGVSVTGYLVQAPPASFRPGTEVLPALVIFSFQPEVSRDAHYMQSLADQLYRAKSAVATPDNYPLVQFARQEPGVLGRRRLLPYFFTDGSTIYCADVWINRKYIRNGCLDGTPLPLLAQTGDSGGIELIPWWLTSPATLVPQDSDIYATQ